MIMVGTPYLVLPLTILNSCLFPSKTPHLKAKNYAAMLSAHGHAASTARSRVLETPHLKKDYAAMLSSALVQASAAISRVDLCTCACFCCKIKGSWNSSYQKQKTMQLCILPCMHICFCPKIKGTCIYFFEMMIAASAIQFIQHLNEKLFAYNLDSLRVQKFETLETSKLHNLQTRDPQVSRPLTRSSHHKPNSTISMEKISLHAVMWAWQLWICLDSIYLFATWTLVSVVVGTTQIQSWSFFWTNLQLCFSIYTSFKRVFFGANKAPCCLELKRFKTFWIL